MKEILKEKEKGITLIALVITIIILLILAGVSIAMLTGENGIITRATEAREETGKKGLKEEIDLAVENDHIEDKAYKNGILKEELNKINGATVTKVAEDAYYVERDGNSYTVYEDGTIENSYNKGQIQAEAQIGGIAGQIGAEYEANIRNCYNEGEIIGNVSAIGGIVGWTSVTGTLGTIENNYNKGIVRGTTSVGGIIGRNAETFTVTKCYNKGTVEGTTNIGSVIGEQSGKNDNISNLYYLSTLNIGGVNGEDIVNKNIIGVSDDINSYDDFLIWIEKNKNSKFAYLKLVQST